MATGVWATIKHVVVPHSHDSIEGIRTAWIGLDSGAETGPEGEAV